MEISLDLDTRSQPEVVWLVMCQTTKTRPSAHKTLVRNPKESPMWMEGVLCHPGECVNFRRVIQNRVLVISVIKLPLGCL